MRYSDAWKKRGFPYLILFICLAAVVGTFPTCSWGESEAQIDPTMLMFVGEDIEVLSIASRREESAWQAPAIADVISREEILERGVTTLSQALSMTPGFFMAEKEWGSLPYLRGISNSILFLYDTVPLNADTSKSLHQLDRQLSMGPVKRIEVVRGPGSALWGADAFAGIVNIVPLTGNDIGGVETDVYHRTPWGQTGATLNMGKREGAWDSILSINGRQGEAENDRSANLIRFWNNPDEIFPPEERMGVTGLPDSRYLDVFGRIAWKDRFSISARYSDNRKPYTISRAQEDLFWRQAREIPGGFIKIETKKDLSSASALRITGYFSQYSPTNIVIDRIYEQQERTSYGELIYDRTFNTGSALFTGGISYREKRVTDAEKWSDYLPDFLGTDNEGTVPQVTQEDYNSRLWSVFSQYSQKIGIIDFSAGIRYDKHDIYKDNISYSLAGVYSHTPRLIFKFMLGTAYRTPYASQLLEEDSPDLEKIQNFSLQTAWAPSDRFEVSLTGFYNRIAKHIQEDPYAGLSLPNHQDIPGLELQGTLGVSKDFELSFNMTYLDNSGPDETYHFLSGVFLRPDGSIEEIYEDFIYDFDAGPLSMFNLMGTWHISPGTSLFARIGYTGSQKLIHPRGESGRTFSGRWLVDVSLQMKNLFSEGLGLGIAVRNLADADDMVPGAYAGIHTAPLEAEFVLRKEW